MGEPRVAWRGGLVASLRVNDLPSVVGAEGRARILYFSSGDLVGHLRDLTKAQVDVELEERSQEIEQSFERAARDYWLDAVLEEHVLRRSVLREAERTSSPWATTITSHVTEETAWLRAALGSRVAGGFFADLVAALHAELSAMGDDAAFFARRAAGLGQSGLSASMLGIANAVAEERRTIPASS
jgi:hypothetical protein